MKREQYEKRIRDTIQQLESPLSKEEEGLILHNVLYAYDNIPKNELDSFQIASILVEAYLRIFRYNSYNRYEIKDLITRKYIDMTQEMNFLREEDILNSAIYFGLSMIENPTLYQKRGRTEVVEKTLEAADYNALFEDGMIKAQFYYKFSSVVHYRTYSGFEDLSLLFHEIYDVAIHNQYEKLRQSCENEREFHEKYGRNSEYYKNRMKIKVIGGRL